MKRKIELTAVIEKEDDVYISLCPELDIPSQGDTPEEAKTNLIEALELFYEMASETEISKRYKYQRKQYSERMTFLPTLPKSSPSPPSTPSSPPPSKTPSTPYAGIANYPVILKRSSNR